MVTRNPPLPTALDLLFFLLVLVSAGNHAAVASASTTFTFHNNCAYTVWPGALSGAGHSSMPTTGFALPPGQSASLAAPPGWSGRFWARTLCSTDPSTGKFSCLTGDCGSGEVQCSGSGAVPPVSLAEFTLAGAGGMDFYDVSLVDGFNIPLLVVPVPVPVPVPGAGAGAGAGGGNCSVTGCVVDLNRACPSELSVTMEESSDGGGGGGAAACESACRRFGSPEYCCVGPEFGSSASCRPSNYSEFFKSACPRAYSYAYDDATSTFTCPSGGATAYTITFCPAASSQKSAGGSSPAGGSSLTQGVPAVVVPQADNNPMIFLAGEEISSSAGGSSPAAAAALSLFIASFFFFFL